MVRPCSLLLLDDPRRCHDVTYVRQLSNLERFLLSRVLGRLSLLDVSCHRLLATLVGEELAEVFLSSVVRSIMSGGIAGASIDLSIHIVVSR